MKHHRYMGLNIYRAGLNGSGIRWYAMSDVGWLQGGTLDEYKNQHGNL